MDISRVDVTLDTIHTSRVVSEKLAVEAKTDKTSVKPLQPLSAEQMEKIHNLRKKYSRTYDWYTGDDGDLRVKIRNGEGDVVQYIPPETLSRIMKDLFSPGMVIDTFV